MDKKKLQLGINPSTASHKLVKDILFRFITTSGYVCYRCKKDLTRDTFSIDHMIPWLGSENPIKTFFDLDNIAFSHQSCNSSAGRRECKKYFTPEEKLEAQRKQSRESRARAVKANPEKFKEYRHNYYLNKST